MKKILSFLLVCLMLLACGCGVSPVEDAEATPAEDLVKLAENKGNEIRLSLSDKAYVRSGKYANMNWREINRELNLDTNTQEVLGLKNNGNPPGDNFRQILLEFDLSEIVKFDYKHVYLSLSFTGVAPGQTYHVYKMDPNSWDGEKVTWNTKPQFSSNAIIARDIVGDNLMLADLTDAVTAILNEGKTVLSIGISGVNVTESDAKINPKTTCLIATDSDSVNSYVYQLVKDEAENKAIWDWADQVFDEWFERFTEVSKKETDKVKLIQSDADEFSKTVYSGNSGFGNWSLSNVNKPHPTRTYAALDDLGKYSDYDKVYPFDIYGGYMDPDMKQAATGFFYSKKLGDRWWIIDPLGYPCYIRAMHAVGMSYMGSPNQQREALNIYGSSEKWQIAICRWLKDDLGFNTVDSQNGFNNVESRMILQTGAGSLAAAYGKKVGTNNSVGGSTTFSENNTMPIFDPGFVTHCEESLKSLEAKKNDPWILGFTSDNELPMDKNMLFNYLSIDPTNPANYYSYASAWTWLINMTGKDNPTPDDVDNELMEQFRGFVWDRYFNVVTTSLRKYDPNHMYLGTRFLTGVKDAPWVARFAAEYLDCMTVNWYGDWEPQAQDLYEFCSVIDLPLMVTEFYTKALENDGSFDDPNDPLKNTRGAGWIVRTQQDRGDFYQNFTLRLLECKYFVGWHWHMYLDDDDSPEVIYINGVDGDWRDQSNIDANKGIVNNWHQPYEELCDSMAEINLNVYRLIKHFDAKYAD